MFSRTFRCGCFYQKTAVTDANGNVLTVNDSHGTITRTYDALNRVSSYTDTYGKVIRYEYDGEERIIRVEEFETLFEEKIVRMY